MTTGIVCTAKPGCRGLATPDHPVCSLCQRQQRLEAMRHSPAVTIRTLARILSLVPHHDLEIEAGG